jgi:hypothetical protein
LKDRALRFLITSYWLIAQARADRIAPSAGEVATRLHAMRANRELTEPLRRLLAERDLAEQSIARALRSTEAPLTEKEVRRYYTRHTGAFERRERRYFDIVEHLPNLVAARTLMSEVVAGRRRVREPIREALDRPRPGQYVLPTKRPIYKAIFASRPHVYVGPVTLNGEYAFFRVTRVSKRKVAPLASVRPTIERRLSEAQRRRVLSRFLRQLRARWIPQTDCAAAYVTVDCREYAGPPIGDERLSGLS